MKTIWMTDDEVVAAATWQPDADHPLILPGLEAGSEPAIAQAVARGIRSLRIRATENDPEQWAAVIDLMRELIARRPLLTAVWVDIDGRPTSQAPLTRYHDLDDNRGVAELVHVTGLHSLGLTRTSELEDLVSELVGSIHQHGPEIPADWPEDAAPPAGLLLIGPAGSMIISAGDARRLGQDGADPVECSPAEASIFVRDTFLPAHGVRA